jgi:hypothetical protein
MFKSTLRRILRAGRAWLAEPSPPRDPSCYPMGEHSYDWLNAAFSKLRTDPICARRPASLWGLLQGAGQARILDIRRISALEFGVAGGNGLVSLERIAEQVGRLCEVKIDVTGFDTGKGLPPPVDHRDVPNMLLPGRFPMDVDALRQRLQSASLALGLISETLPEFLEAEPPPVAFVSIDVDLYTSTVETLRLFDAHASRLLPRVYCYFDDIHALTYSDCNGELLAIADFNSAHSRQKVSKIHGLRYYVVPSVREMPWVERMYIAHMFDHPLYAKPSVVSGEVDRTPLRATGQQTSVPSRWSRARRNIASGLVLGELGELGEMLARTATL